MVNEQKQNYSIKIDCLKLNGAFMKNLTGKTATKRCLIIPVDDNECMYYELQNSQYGDTHLLKGDLPKEVRERMTEEERNAIPILGNMRPIKPQQMQVTGSVSMDAPDGQQQDDLPF